VVSSNTILTVLPSDERGERRRIHLCTPSAVAPYLSHCDVIVLRWCLRTRTSCWVDIEAYNEVTVRDRVDPFSVETWYRSVASTEVAKPINPLANRNAPSRLSFDSTSLFDAFESPCWEGLSDSLRCRARASVSTCRDQLSSKRDCMAHGNIRVVSTRRHFRMFFWDRDSCNLVVPHQCDESPLSRVNGFVSRSSLRIEAYAVDRAVAPVVGRCVDRVATYARTPPSATMVMTASTALEKRSWTR